MKKFIIFFLLIVAGVLLYNVTANNLKNFQAGDLGLGIATTSHEVSWESLPVNQTEGNYDLILPSFRKFKEKNKKIVLLTGNSQLHAINYYTEGNQLAVYRLNELAKQSDREWRFLQLSSPNINFMEMLIYYLSLKQQGFKPDWMVIGATYRSFQLASFRKSFLDHLEEIDFNGIRLSKNVKKVYDEELKQRKKRTGTIGEKNSQEKIEEAITQTMENSWGAYRYRGNVQSGIKVLPGIAYRNLLVKNNSYSGSDAVEELNMIFLRELVRLCKEDGVKVLIYKPPHPQSNEKFHYNLDRYNMCFSTIKEFSDENQGIYFRDFENIVRLEDWGLDGGGRLDIFHFKDRGHEALAQSIFDFLQTVR